jgi:acyl-CoA synthetase (AMP-forming)/AMP-acid ligase II
MADSLPEISGRIATILELDVTARAVEFERLWYSWGDLAVTAGSLEGRVQSAQRVGLLLRNRPPQLGLLIGLLRSGACVVAINPGRGPDRVRADINGLGLPAIAGEPSDVHAFAGPDPGLTRITASELGAPVQTEGPARATGPATRRPGVAVEMLTSGTTGPPKRVPLTYETFHRVLAGAKYYERDAKEEPQLRSGVAIVNAPLVHLGGLFRVLQCLNDGRSFCLLERFQVDEWVDAVRRHRPRTVSLVPAALRMVLDADVDPADLSSLRSVISGTAPLSPDDADAFKRRFGAPVLVSYAATEFGGGVAGWNLSDHQRFWAAKRGSVGRAHPGCGLRVVDADTGMPVPVGQDGLLEVKADQMGDGSGWTRTTDLARMDDDGFLWILGRADQAIIRGGFKVLPDDVRVALERDSRVRAAAVVGRDDPRLGAVPVAAVELRSAESDATPEDLLKRASKLLARYELPAEIRIVDALPRTPSGKVELAAVRDLFSLVGPDGGGDGINAR